MKNYYKKRNADQNISISNYNNYKRKNQIGGNNEYN